MFLKVFPSKEVKGLRWVVNPFDRQGGYISALEAIIFFGVNARERDSKYMVCSTQRDKGFCFHLSEMRCEISNDIPEFLP